MGVSAGPRKIEKGSYLFRENDPSDAMYVIKSGRIAITKAKGSSEIILAEVGPGQMLGEMAFFDGKPRSASAKALVETDVIALPFKSLYAQFKTFPEWLKAMVKTVNSNLREANLRIKNIERAATEEDMAFPAHRINKMIALLCLVASRYGQQEEKGTSVPAGTLRRYTIQVFQEPTNKMQKLMEILSGLGHMSVTDLGEGKQKIVIHKLDILLNMVDFYTEYLFTEESKRAPTIEDAELKVLKGVLHYGRKHLVPDSSPAMAMVYIEEMQNMSFADLKYQLKQEDLNTLIEKKVIGELMSGEQGLYLKFNLNEVERIYPYWEIIHTLLKLKN